MIKFSDILLESSEKIKCNHCGWSWKKSEGGKDLHVCHKCGHDNEPIKEGELTERCWKGYKPNPDGRPAKEQGSCVEK